MLPGRVVIGESVEGVPAADERRGLSGARTGCGCDQVVIDAINELRDAEVKTGDAEVRNVNVTYISAGFMAAIEDEFELEVDQRAEAFSGDATAGQILSAVAAAGRCADVLIRAINLLEDVEVRSGDAVASNRNIVLLDPGVDRERIDFDIDQDAVAVAGSAVAGQVIGAASAGPDGCGRVTVDATNDLKDVEVETGEAEIENVNDIRTCAASGCAPELLRVARSVPAVRMCTEGGCRMVSGAELVAQLEAAAPATPAPLPPPLEAPPGPDDEGTEPPASADPDASAEPEGETEGDDEPSTPAPGSPSPTPASA